MITLSASSFLIVQHLGTTIMLSNSSVVFTQYLRHPQRSLLYGFYGLNTILN